MISESSRYRNVPRAEARTPDGRVVDVVRLRRPPTVAAEEITVQQNDRLDIIAHRRYGDATKFWRIADANTELDPRALATEPGRVIRAPKS